MSERHAATDAPPVANAQPAPARLLAAARELLTEVPAGNITVRMIAGRAGVGHSLITRHFGSRNNLLTIAIGATLVAIADEVTRAIDIWAAVRGAFHRMVENRELVAAVIAITADSEAVEQREGFPIADAFAAQLEAAGVPPLRAHERATTITLMIFNWAGAEDRWLRSAGHPDDPTTGRYQYLQTLFELVDNTVTGEPASGPSGPVAGDGEPELREIH